MEEFILKNGTKVILRRVRATDFDAARDFMREFSTQTIFTHRYPGQPDIDREKSIQLYESEDAHFVGAFLPTGKMIGNASFRIDHPNHPWAGRNCGFGITILADYCSSGLGTRLMQLLEQEARVKNMHRIYGSVRAKNTRAIGLYLKQGFEIDGLFKQTAFINGEWHDEYHISKILE